MAKKKEEEVKKGLDEWMGTFSDMMTLLMCFFVMLFAMSSIDAAKFEEAAQSFQQTISIFKGGAKAIGDGILVSNGVSQLNQLDEFFNTTGKTAASDTDELEFQENAQGKQSTEAVAEKLGLTEEEKHRHDVRPGLSGLAQVNGRNSISWEEKFEWDVQYVDNITFWGDVKIIFNTVKVVFKRDGISSETSATMEEFRGSK